MLTSVFDLAASNLHFTHDFGVVEFSIDEQLIHDMEQLFERHGMVNCGRLLSPDDIDSDEYLVDPLDFRIRELYDRRMPKTHFFSIYNVQKAYPIPATAISLFTMNEEDDIEFLSFMPDVVERRNRSFYVKMKLRALQFAS